MPQRWEPRTSFDELNNAVKANDRETIRALITALAAYASMSEHAYPTKEAEALLILLRRRRMFPELREAAEVFLNNDCATFRIRSFYAQALIDMGFLVAAESVLSRLEADTRAFVLRKRAAADAKVDAERWWTEACGLLGRLNKDRFINAHAPQIPRSQAALNQAIARYYGCYAENDAKMKDRHWHGINAIALARLAERHGIAVTVQFDAAAAAQRILAEVKLARQENDQPLGPWTTAIAMEACLALGKLEDAYTWAREYADPKREGVDAFEIGATLRQLEQVWELEVEVEPGSLLIPLLRTRLMDLEGFQFRVDPDEPTNESFLSDQVNRLEKKFGGAFLSFGLYREGISRAQSVARIGRSSEEGFGTGFLIEGGDLHPRLANQRLLMTCDHVVSRDNAQALRPNRAVVTFRADDGNIRKHQVDSIVWSRPAGDLDVSVLRLKGDVSDLPVVAWAQGAPGPGEQRVLIFGHPEGGPLSFSIGDNRLVDRNERFFQYRAPTEGGSSGSPVFNLDWDLIAVHNRGGLALPQLSGTGLHAVNQGSSVFAIREAIQAELPAA